MNRDQVIDTVVVSGASQEVGGYDDYVYLAEVSSQVQRSSGVTGEDLLRETLSIVEEILRTKLMIVGDLTPDMSRLVPWQLSVPEALARIEREWRALGRAPNLWEICWFTNTAAGNETARSTGLISG
jgi:hypothetical protein